MKALALIVIQLFSLIFSQYNLSGSYVSSYGNSVNNFNFFENRFNLNADWRNWTAWMELEHSNPPELGKSIMGLRKLRFEYHSDDFTMKIGDIYEYWGNGLVFNMLDDQSIDMDTGIRGGLLSYSPGVVSAEYLIGTQKTWLSTNQAPDFSDRVSNYETHYDLQAGKLSLMLTNNIYFQAVLRFLASYSLSLFEGPARLILLDLHLFHQNNFLRKTLIALLNPQACPSMEELQF